MDTVATGFAHHIMGHVSRIDDLEVLAGRGAPQDLMNATLRFAETRGIGRRDPDDLFDRPTARFFDEPIQILIHLLIAQIAIHPIGPELNDENRRLMFPDQVRELWRPRWSRGATIHPVGEDIGIARPLPVAALGNEIRLT